MGRSEEEAGTRARRRSAWRRGLLGALVPLALLAAWQVDPALIFPGAPKAAPAPVVVPAEPVEPLADLPLLPPAPPPPPALAPRVPQRVPHLSLELPRRHRDLMARALATQAASEAVAPDPDPDPLLALAPDEEVYPIGLPDNPLADLRPLYFVDGPGGGLRLRKPKLPPAPVPEPGTALLVALGLGFGASAAAVRRERPAGSPPRGRPRPALP